MRISQAILRSRVQRATNGLRGRAASSICCRSIRMPRTAPSCITKGSLAWQPRLTMIPSHNSKTDCATHIWNLGVLCEEKPDVEADADGRGRYACSSADCAAQPSTSPFHATSSEGLELLVWFCG